MKKQIITFTLLILLFDFVKAEDRILDDIVFSIPNINLQNGKINVNNNSDTEVVPNVMMFLVKNTHKTTSKFDAELMFVLFDESGFEHIISPLITFDHNYFEKPYISIGSWPKYTSLTFNSKAKKKGIVMLKYREKVNNTWNPYVYAKRSYLLNSSAPQSITGSTDLCLSEEYVTINVGKITLENAAGIASLTKLENNKYKVTRIADGYGVVRLKYSVGNEYNYFDIKVGYLNGRIEGEHFIFTNDHPDNYNKEFTVLTDPSENFNITLVISDRSPIELISRNGNKLRFTIKQPWTFERLPYQDYFKITIKGTSNGCVKYVTKKINVLPDPRGVNDGDNDGPGSPQGPQNE